MCLSCPNFKWWAQGRTYIYAFGGNRPGSDFKTYMKTLDPFSRSTWKSWIHSKSKNRKFAHKGQSPTICLEVKILQIKFLGPPLAGPERGASGSGPFACLICRTGDWGEGRLVGLVAFHANSLHRLAQEEQENGKQRASERLHCWVSSHSFLHPKFHIRIWRIPTPPSCNHLFHLSHPKYVFPHTPFFSWFSSCTFFLFFFWWVLVNLTLVFHVASRFTMPQSPSGKLWKTGDYRTGVSRILSLFVSLSCQHSPLISISYWWVFSVWGYCCCTFVTGGVVHEKGLLPQDCK